jgi:hypothetical protein
MCEQTRFLNVDLDLSSREDLASLAAALHPRLFVLHVGRIRRRYWARLELRAQPRSVDSAIRRLVRAIQSMPRRQQACWNRAITRDFNIGIQVGEEPRHGEFPLAPPTVQMVGAVRGRIVITVYGAAVPKAEVPAMVLPNPRMQPTGRLGAGRRTGGTLRRRR